MSRFFTKNSNRWIIAAICVVVILLAAKMFWELGRFGYTGPYDFPNSTWVCEETGITLQVDEYNACWGTLVNDNTICYFCAGFDSVTRHVEFVEISKEVYDGTEKLNGMKLNDILIVGAFKANKKNMTVEAECYENGAKYTDYEEGEKIKLVFIRTA